jgi:hypothetical protein
MAAAWSTAPLCISTRLVSGVALPRDTQAVADEGRVSLPRKSPRHWKPGGKSSNMDILNLHRCLLYGKNI